MAHRVIGIDRHFSAEEIHREIGEDGHRLSVGTVYNALRQFARVGLIRELAIEGMRSVYDSNTTGHHHFHLVEEDTIIDIPPGTLIVSEVPEVPEGHEISRVEVIVRLKRLDEAQGGAERRRPLATFRRSLQRDLPKLTS
jgi:Fur family iron response transcriptional regulator